ENVLYEAALRGEAWAVCFYLKCQAKDRGYVERQETRDVSDEDIDALVGEALRDLGGPRPGTVSTGPEAGALAPGPQGDPQRGPPGGAASPPDPRQAGLLSNRRGRTSPLCSRQAGNSLAAALAPREATPQAEGVASPCASGHARGGGPGGDARG